MTTIQQGNVMEATLDAPKTTQKHTGMMAELNESGDTKVLWDKDSPDEVEAARATFDKLTKRGKFAAFNVKGKDGEQAGRMHTFDPSAERIILVPQLAGG